MNYDPAVWFWQVTLPVVITILLGTAHFHYKTKKLLDKIDAILGRIETKHQ